MSFLERENLSPVLILHMNHKRKRPKNRRSGCLACKAWKVNGYGKENSDWERFSDHKRRMFAKQDIQEVKR